MYGRVRCREGFIVPISQHQFIILIQLIIYTQYVIIAYCFIMYYSTDVQIFATICNK